MIESKYGPLKVFHFREVDFNGNPNNTGGSTYVFAQVENKWLYATAHCSYKDNFCRKIGRNVARGRLEKGYWKEWKGGTVPEWETVNSLWLRESLQELTKHLPHFEVHEYV